MPAVRRSPRRAQLAALPVVLTLGLGGLAGCQGDPPHEPATVPSASSTPLASVDTNALTVPRADFCGLVAPAQAREALGAEVASSTSYANGDPARLAPGVRDVAHEFGCTWTAADGAVARAWVFAPPVTRARANALRRDELRPGCTRAKGPAYGAPSVATRCSGHGREGTELGYFGLFGDAWLSCTLTLPPGADWRGQPERADRWCAAVLLAAAAG
ncbi:MAG: hypothetical protein JWO76_3587 [Nocardioides sp.]|nr:hypothetical protein [Nocardioides sp.]